MNLKILFLNFKMLIKDSVNLYKKIIVFGNDNLNLVIKKHQTLLLDEYSIGTSDNLSYLNLENIIINSLGSIILFDITSLKSYDNAKSFYYKLITHLPNITTVLCGIGNKNKRIMFIQDDNCHNTILLHRNHNNIIYCENYDYALYYLSDKLKN